MFAMREIIHQRICHWSRKHAKKKATQYYELESETEDNFRLCNRIEFDNFHYCSQGYCPVSDRLMFTHTRVRRYDTC